VYAKLISLFEDLTVGGFPECQRIELIIFCKLLAATGRVQLIVFFSAIREILKRKIYGRDKGMLVLAENKSVEDRCAGESGTNDECDAS
jgi:hypothetical protein